MKLTYQAPAYRHIALDETTAASGCVLKAPHTSLTCAFTVTIGDGGSSGLFGGTTVIKYNMFSNNACSTPPESVPSEYGGGANAANVFGS